MSYKLKDNTTNIVNKTKINASIFLRNAAEEIVRMSEPNTPKDSGDLRRNVLKSILGLNGTIKWIKDYAVYQEVKQFRNYTTPGTGPHFAENAVKEVAKKTNMIAKKSGLI